jgi:hypothetical protein
MRQGFRAESGVDGTGTNYATRASAASRRGLALKTLVRHRAEFHHSWRWKSRSWEAGTQIDADMRALI